MSSKALTLAMAEYFIQNGNTIRSTAKQFGVSKTTVHKYFTKRDLPYSLYKANRFLYACVLDTIAHNKRERHIRGGEATRLKWMKSYQVGDKVVFIDKQGHIDDPTVFPRVGTVGTIMSNDGHGLYKVRWPMGSTSCEDEWYVSFYRIRKKVKG